MSKRDAVIETTILVIALAIVYVGRQNENYLAMGLGGMLAGAMCVLLFSGWREQKVG